VVRTLAVLLCLSAAGLRAADSASTPVGRWRTFDDKIAGKAKAIIVLYEEKGLLFGRVETLVDPDAVKICDKCSDERKGQAVTGMVVVRRMKKDATSTTEATSSTPRTGRCTAARCASWTRAGSSRCGLHWLFLVRALADVGPRRWGAKT